MPILTENERHQVLYEWNDTYAAYPDVCVHELFEQQVARDPDAVAVVFKEQHLTYWELNQRSNQVAHYLQKRGVGPEMLVGVCLERSPELVIALLGVWKAGGAYLPFDPAYPRERLSFMVRDAGVKVLMTDEKCRNLLPSANDSAICLDSDWPEIAQESTSNLATAALPSNLVYVMYTSGSTGQPKGVMIQHNSLVNYLCWAMRAYVVEGKGSVPVHTSIAFDSTVASLYPPLLAGKQIELLPEDVGAQSLLAALRNVKNRSKVVVTPAHLELLNQQLSPEEMTGITRILVIAGETLQGEKLIRWRNLVPPTRLINEYGPTETTVGCCAYEVQPEDPSNGPVPIGRPIANTQLYVLDANLNPVPPGVTGELYIGGAGVARGYLNRPELTQEKFLVDPFSGQSGARLYKTGDLARYREDGTLECLGRVDDQVKVRGCRIELGEIEASLRRKKGVRDVVILPYTNQWGEKRLSAFVVREPDLELSVEELFRFLRRSLPEYMVPSRCCVLDRWPLSANGKIDRQGLAASGAATRERSSPIVPSRTTSEKVLAEIWEELLNVRPIGTRDNFFELGGDSLLAVRLLARIDQVIGKKLPEAALLDATTIEELAALLDEETAGRSAYAVAVQPNGEKPAFAFVGAGFLFRPLCLQLGTDRPIYSIGLKPESANQFKTPFQMEELAQHLVLALRERQPEGPYYLGGFCDDGLFAYEVARQLTMHGQKVGLLVLFEPVNPCTRANARIATRLRRMVIQVHFRGNQLLQLRNSETRLYASARREEFKQLLKQLLWRNFQHFRVLKREPGPPDLERILFLAASSYKPKPVECPTVIFRCKDWPIASAGDPYMGWRELITGRCETYEVPGDHIGIFSESNAKVLVARLRASLDDASCQIGLSTT